MSATQHGDTCGCCTGLETRTPVDVTNAPGLKAIAYRVGTWASLRESMLARFAMTRTAAGDALDPRSGQNFAAALADAWAVVGDILTFYQERIANESYLRTATERASVVELARMIGYKPKPGVAADAWLAFTIDDPPAVTPADKAGVASLPLPVRRDSVLAAGLKVQSVPGPDEKPQTFETVEAIVGWPEWNAIPLRIRQPQFVNNLVDVVWLRGEVALVPGEYLLLDIAGTAHIRRVVTAAFDELARTTRVAFTDKQDDAIAPNPLVTQYEELSSSILIREKKPLTSQVLNTQVLKNGNTERAWRAEDLSTVAELQGWNVDELEKSMYRYAQRDRNVAPRATLYRFEERAALFAHNAPDPAKLPQGAPTIPDVETQSLREENDAAKTDKIVDLDTTYPDIANGTWIILRRSDDEAGRRAYRITNVAQRTLAKYYIAGKATRLTVDSSADFENYNLRETAVFAETIRLPFGTEPAFPTVTVNGVSRKGLRLDGVFLRLRPGQRVVITGRRKDLDGETGHEQRTLTEVRIEAGLTTIYFDTPLAIDFDWTTVTVNANVARATHGESTRETLGSGNAGQPYQRFALRQKPLTYTGSSTPAGAESSLRVFVNDVEWKEAEMLFGRAATERIFTTHRADDGTVSVQFGDGLTGARVPSGVENVRAEYRKGIGLEGLVRADQLTLLLSRPLGAKGVTNPLPSVDAGDPEPRDEARRNAPLQVLTLGRAVSLRDYEDFARGFAGVAKSHAGRVSGREKPEVFVTVAAANGAEFNRTDVLTEALHAFGDPFVPVTVKSLHSVLFRIEATVRIEPDRVVEVMKKAIEKALRERYAFEAQAFGQPVFRSEVIAVIQSVEGVLSTLVKLLDPNAIAVDAIPARVPIGEVLANTLGADLLTLDPRPVALTVTK